MARNSTIARLSAAHLWVLCASCLLPSPVLAEFELPWDTGDSPYLREAQMDMALGYHFSAIGHLVAEQHRGTFGGEQATAELMLAYNYLKYGMHHEAAATLSQLPVNRRQARRKGELWLELANIRFQRGYLEQAHAALAQIDDNRIRYALLEQKFVLSGLVYLQQNNLGDAVKNLVGARSNSTWGMIGKFNLGATMLQRSEISAGRGILETLARDLYGSSEMLALRDRTYFTLGFLDLQYQNIPGARENFQAVRLDSPVANRALLGLGLSYAAAGAHPQAISTWQELAKGDASDASVLEALLAIPASFGALGDYRQSIENYQAALDTFRSEIKRIDFISAAIEDGTLIATLLQQMALKGETGITPDKLPVLPEFQHLRNLYVSHPFQIAVTDYRDLRRLQQRLEQWATNIYNIPDVSPTFKKVYVDQIAAQQSTLAQTAEELKLHIAKLAQAELTKRKQRIVSYTKQALFAMAQNYDTSSFNADLK